MHRAAKRAYFRNEPERARQLMHEAWDAAAVSGDHQLCAEVAHSAADLFARLKDKKPTETMARRAVHHKEQTGVTDILYANYLAFLADLLAPFGRYAEALLLGEQALAIEEELLGPDHREARMLRAMCRAISRRANKLGSA